MSYRCTISFKIIEPTELYSFLLQYKQECLKNYVNIAEENCLCSPVWRENQDTSFIDLKTLENAEELEQKTEIWAKNHVFKYRWFYLADKKLLGIYAVPISVYHLFDSTLQFQNSGDQDYDYDYWNDIPLFKSIADKYRYMSNDEMIKEYEKRRNEKWVSEDSVSEYYIKTFIYEDIWDMIENTLYNDKEVLHISLLGEFDYFITEKFFKETVKAVNEYLRKMY